MSFVDPAGETNPNPRSADFILGAQRGAISQALGSLDADPEEAARSLELSAATGVPAPIINGDLENFERQHKAALTANLLTSSEYLRTFINSNPMAAKVANDSYAQLDALAQKVTDLGLVRTAFDRGFREGFGPDALGTWAISSEEGKKYPETARALGALGSPVELVWRTISGSMRAVTEIAKDVATELDPVLGAGFGHEIGGLAEAELMGLTGRHGPGQPSAANLWRMVEKIKPYAENGREPPPGLVPELDKVRAEQNAADVDKLKDITQDAQAVPLRERSPELFKQFIAQHTDAEIGISGDAVAALYGDKLPEVDDNLLGWVPGIAEKLELARETGADVRIPLADWLAHVDLKVMDALKEDIRVRPNGITAREATRAAEVEAAATPSEPLSGEVPGSRAAYALEPMLSVGDRKLKLERIQSMVGQDARDLAERNGLNWDELSAYDRQAYADAARGNRFGVAQGFHDFSINDQNGTPVGTINLTETKGGKELYVDYIHGINGLGPRDFGPALMRSILAQLKQEFPNAETITGHRVTGARDRIGTWEAKSAHPVIKLDNPKGWETAETNAEWRRILEGGRWEAFSPKTRAYIKPYAERSVEDRKLVDIVNEELARIVPQKVTAQPAERIVAQRATGQGDATLEPSGSYIRYRDTYPIILYSLEGPDPLGTARHEAIHHLRNYGFFKPEEWSILEQAAKDNGWIDRFGIERRYPKGNEALHLEESIADAYKHWKAGAAAPSPEVHGIFEKMKAFFLAIKERIVQLLGKEPTWEDIFQKVDTGEIGRREGTEPLEPGAYNEKLAVEHFRRAANDNEQKLNTQPIADAFALHYKETVTDPHEEFIRKYDELHAYGQEILKKGNWTELNVARYNKMGKELDPNWTEIEFDPLGLMKSSALDEKLSVPEEPQGGSRVFERAQALGMTVAQFRRYDELMQQRHAEDIEAATKRAMEERGREQTKEWKENRKALRQEVVADIKGRPDVAADLFFGAQELYGKKVEGAKLNAADLTEAQKAALPRSYFGGAGLHPDDVANLFGYGSGGAMLDHLVAYNQAKLTANMSAKDFVSRVTDIETDRQMQMRYGNLERNIIDAVQEQVSGETQQNLLHEETLKLGLASGKTLLDKDTILAQLREQFAKMPLGSVSSAAYMRAAGKAGREAEFGLLGNDPEAAFRAKQQQYYATVIANEAAKLEKELGKFDKVAKRFSAREVPSIDPEYTNFIHDVLMRVGRSVRRSVQDLEGEIAAGEYKDLKSFVEGKQGFYLREVAVADMLFDPAFRKKFEDLTVDEFNAVNTSIKSLIANGRDEQKITKAGDAADLAAIRAQMINQLKQFQERAYDAKGGRWMGPIPPRVAKVLRTYGAAHIQIENLFNRWDHDDPQGVFQQYIMRDLVDAANSESAMEKRYAGRLREIDDKADLKAKVDNPLFKVPGTEQLMQLNRGNLRAILLNVGNDSNLSKLARGYNIPKEQVLAWVHQHATKEDWDWAQKMGDIFKDIKAEADTMYRQLSGVAPESIPLEPIQTPHGQYPGWYYPLIAHPEFEGPTKRMMGPNALEQEGFVRATTANGYTKARTGVAYPLALDLDMLPPRMKQMIHDISMRPSIINASKIFYDKEVRSAIFTRFGAEWRDMLVPYLVDVANSANYMPKEQKIFAQASEFIRQNLISTLVGLNPGTVLKHGPTAFVQSVHEVGPIEFLKAMKSLFSINDRTGDTNWSFAMNTSEELQRRHQNYVETLGGATDLLQPSSGYGKLRSTVQRFAATPVALSDLLSAVPTWLAQYEKTIGEGETHGDAVYMADRAVRRAHGSVAVTNRSAVMRGGALAQWFASVYGFFNHIMNRQYELLWKSGETLDMVKDGDYREAMQRAPELTSMLFAYVVAPALIEEMVTPLMSEDGESWGKKAAKGLAFTLGASWIGVRDVANALLNGRDPSVGLISTAAKTITDFGRDLNKQGPFSKEHAGKVVRDGATLLGSLTGVVPTQVGRVGQFVHGVQSGVERPKGPWGWLTGLRYGTIKGHPATFDEWQRHHLGGRR